MSILDDRTQHAEDELTELQHRYDKLLAAAKALCDALAANSYQQESNKKWVLDQRLGPKAQTVFATAEQLRAAIEEAEPLQP